MRFVGVSLDPERDTLQAATKYLEALPSPQGMLFLTGTREALESVWRSYKVEAKQVMTTPKEGTPIEGSHAGHKGYIVAHNIIAYLIDTQGVVRAVYVPDQDFESGDLVKDMRNLLSVR